MLSDLPRFNAARRYGPMLLAIGAAFALLGLALYWISAGPNQVPWYPDLSIPASTSALGVALWLAAAGFLSAAAMSFARQYTLNASKSHGQRSERSAADAA